MSSHARIASPISTTIDMTRPVRSIMGALGAGSAAVSARQDRQITVRSMAVSRMAINFFMAILLSESVEISENQ